MMRITVSILIGGMLVSTAWDSARAAEKASTSKASENDSLFVAGTVNAAGFALFGPDLNVEVGGAQFAAVGRVRPFGLGYLSHSMFVPEDNRELSLGSLSLGLGARAYLGNRAPYGLFAGVAAEYLTVDIDESLPVGEMNTTTTFLIPAAEAGYRVEMGPLLLGGGAQLGYAFALNESCTLSTGACTVEPRDNTVYGQLVLEIGAVF